MANPTLNDLVGGIHSVTLGDEEARRRGTQKTILERKAPPTFQILIELHKRWEMTIHRDVAYSVDQLLRNYPPATESRRRGEDDRIITEIPLTDSRQEVRPDTRSFTPSPVKPVRIYYLGLTRKFITMAAHSFGAAVDFVDEIEDADLILVLKKFYKKRPQTIRQAESEGVPVFIVRANTQPQIESTLMSVTLGELSPEDLALHEAEQAVQRLRQGESAVELSPQNDTLRRIQHHYLEQHNVRTRSKGYKNRRRVVVSPRTDER